MVDSERGLPEPAPPRALAHAVPAASTLVSDRYGNTSQFCQYIAVAVAIIGSTLWWCCNLYLQLLDATNLIAALSILRSKCSWRLREHHLCDHENEMDFRCFF